VTRTERKTTKKAEINSRWKKGRQKTGTNVGTKETKKRGRASEDASSPKRVYVKDSPLGKIRRSTAHLNFGQYI
jgi:hypothetical protein